MRQTLRPYQQALVDDAIRHQRKCDALPDDAPTTERRILYSSPTATGKGTVELALQRALLDGGLNAWILTPSLEILRGFLERTIGCPPGLSAEHLAALGESVQITTPTRMQHRILSGDRAVPDAILYDEVHHAIEGNDVSGTLLAVAPLASWYGFTATPFRGTPQSTRELEEAWPEQVEVLSIPQAVEQGWWSFPTVEVQGLVDDDLVKIKGGEFEANAAGSAVEERVDAIAGLVRDRQAARRLPTAVIVPNRASGASGVEALDAVGIDSTLISAETPTPDRERAYVAAAKAELVLVSVKVIAEGVDFPWLRRLVDARPSVSPVAWLQLFGRITRLHPDRSEYICVCRNLERFAYLLGGLVPRTQMKAIQDAFEVPSKRDGIRSIGFEALSRFKAIPLPLSGGVRGTMHIVYEVSKETGLMTEWATLISPNTERAIVASRVSSAPKDDGTRDWGRWQRAELPRDLAGFATSQKRDKMSAGQAAWWKREAARRGLDVTATPTKRQFNALPVLSHLGTSI